MDKAKLANLRAALAAVGVDADALLEELCGLEEERHLGTNPAAAALLEVLFSDFDAAAAMAEAGR